MSVIRLYFPYLFISVGLILVVGCAAATPSPETGTGSVAVIASGQIEVPPTPTLAPLPNLGPAPEWQNDLWLNTPDERPLRLADLRGKVILLEFWTFSCINCQRVLPYIKDWQEKYSGDSFQVVSIHYPEFKYEENVDNVRAAAAQANITYPIAIDNDGFTWRAYNQRYWPTRYLIDKQGNIRFIHIGERAYSETEAYIQLLMSEPDLP
ncbi:MAG: redoxin domain-containing protein [Anaerolineae bacterium]|nr:redoxin domain-containing protein [Anaerolineae bacterium]